MEIRYNEITVSPVTTPYGYEEHYLLVDGISVAELTDRFVRENGDNDLKRFKSLNGLCPAWGPGMQNRGEVRYIHQLLWQEEPVNLPILVCEDDLDLSCIVIVTAVRKQGGAVFWDRIGYVDHSEWDPGREMVSGILCLEAYTEDDWARYGDNIALEQVGSRDWRLWISEHWDEELYRRRMNYTLPYCQDERHIRWLKDTGYAFNRTAYENCIRFYPGPCGPWGGSRNLGILFSAPEDRGRSLQRPGSGKGSGTAGGPLGGDAQVRLRHDQGISASDSTGFSGI